jgi:hypothetical protein
VNGAEQVVAGVEVLAGIKSNALPVPVALLHPAGRTDEAGTFHLQGLPAGSDAYVATRTSRGQPWNVHGPFKTEAMPLRVQLSKPSGLLVRLHDEAGKPLADAELFIAPDPLEGGAPLPPIFAPPMQKLTEVSDVELGTKRVAGLDFGKYRLIGRAAGFALAQATVDVVDPPREYELLFQSANVLEVHVVRAKDREPLEWAFASLCPEGMFERPIARGRTDDEGRVDLARIPAGKYVLTVQHPAQATQEMKVEVPSPPVTVALPLGGHLKGRASDRGQDPGKSLFLILTQKDVKRPDAAMPTFSATAETGDFAVANLEAATYHYEFRDRIVGKGPLALIETMRDDPLAKGEVEIREGETTQLDVDVSGLTGGPVAELFGTVWINGVPTPDLSIRVEGPRNVTVKSDERGAWRFDAVPAGQSVLTVQALKENGDLFQFASALHREEIELTAGESRRIALTLEIAAVRGRVTGPGPLPAGLGTNVILRDPASNLMLFTAPNPLTGSYEFASVPRGTYELLVRKPGAAPFTTTVVVDPTHGDVVCDAELVGSIRVSGRIVLPKDATPQADGRKTTFNDLNGGTQVVSGWIILVDTEGRPAGRGRVDWDALTFSIDDCAPGNYSAQLFGRDPALVSHGVVIPRGGSSDLVLAFEKPKEGETLINPLAGPSRRLRGN